MKDPDKVLAMIDQIEANRAEQGRRLAELRLWALVAKQGIDTDTVRSFGFDPQLLTPEQIRVLRLAHRMVPVPFGPDYAFRNFLATRYFNVVFHKDGSDTPLDPPVPRPGNPT